jgi:hypothetical protein
VQRFRLPSSLQIVGRHFDEATVLRIGHATSGPLVGASAIRRCEWSITRW